MDFHGYDTGDPNIWYQSRPDLREPAAEYGGNYHGSHFHGFSPSIHPHQFYSPHLWMSSPNPVPSNPSFYHHTSYNPPPLPNHTIINGHSLPLQFPFSSQISQPLNHQQPSQPTYYPQSQLYNPYVGLSTQQFHTQPSILPTKATTTPPIYQSSPVPQHDLFKPTEINLLDQVTYTQFSYTSLQLEDTKVSANVDKSSPRDELTAASGQDMGWIDEIGKVRHGGQHYEPDIVSATPLNLEPCLQMIDPETNGAINIDLVSGLTPLFSFTTSKCEENIVSKDFSSMKESTLGVCENVAEDSKVVNLDMSHTVTSAVVDESSFWDYLRRKGYTMLSMVNTNHDNCTRLPDDFFSMDCTKPPDILHRYDFLHDIAIEDFSKEEFLHVFIALVYDCCKLCPFEARLDFLWNVLEPNFAAMNISYSPLVNFKLGKVNLPTCDKFEELKQNVSLLFKRMWKHWKLKLTVEISLNGIGEDKKLNVEFINKTTDCLENIRGCNINLTNDNDALWTMQYQIVCSSLPTAWVLPIQSSCHNMRRIIESHFGYPNLSDIGIYEAVTKVTNIGVIDYSSSCFILVSQNLFQVTILNSKSKVALLGLQFVMSSVTLELLFVKFDKSGSMFMHNIIKALGDVLLEYNHWIVEWAKDKPGWEELLKCDSRFNQHMLVGNVIGHAQLNVETLLDEMGHTRVLGLHGFLDEVHVRILALDLAIKCANHHSLIMKFEDYIATTIHEVTSLRLLTFHLVLVLFALLKCLLGVKLETTRHGSLVLKFLKAIILYCSYILADIQACVWLNLLQLVDFFFNGDKHRNVLQRFMEFQIMILGKNTTSELTVRQGAIVENHQRYLEKLNARYVALLKLREVIFVEEFGKIVSFRVSSEEVIDSPKIISEPYPFWVFEVDTKVALATLRIDQFMSLTFLDQFITNNYVFNMGALLEVHYHLVGYYVGVKNFPQIGFEGNFGGKRVFAGQEPMWSLDLQLCHGNLATVGLALRMNQGYYSLLTVQYNSVMIRLSTEPTLEWFIKQKTLIQVITRARGENEEFLLLNVTLLVLGFSAYSDAHCNILLHILAGSCFAILYSMEVRIAGMMTTIIVDWLWQVLFLLTNGESIYVESTWQSKTKTHSLCLPFHDKLGVCKVTMIAELVHKEDDLLYYLLQRITPSMFYFGFVSSLFNYGCSWYNIFGAVFDKMMTLKLLSIVDSSHGTSLKTLGLSYVQGMRTCLKLRGRDC